MSVGVDVAEFVQAEDVFSALSEKEGVIVEVFSRVGIVYFHCISTASIIDFIHLNFKYGTPFCYPLVVLIGVFDCISSHISYSSADDAFGIFCCIIERLRIFLSADLVYIIAYCCDSPRQIFILMFYAKGSCSRSSRKMWFCIARNLC